MKRLSERLALEKLQKLKDDFTKSIKSNYEHKAKSCLTCETNGACCLDAHFVNVHITKLEAIAIQNTLANLTEHNKAKISQRIERTINKYKLSRFGDTFSQTYACPLFEKGTGCLVHFEGKPLPCIQHACYENKEDLPPDELLAEQEGRVEKLNILAYGKRTTWLPLPLAIHTRRTD